jgi:hypothetical protein
LGEERKRDAFDFMLRGNEQGSRNHPNQEKTEHEHLARDFMFGDHRRNDRNDNESHSEGSSFLSQIDFDEVLHHVDTLISSAKELKPLFGKVRPYIDNFIDKNKS